MTTERELFEQAYTVARECLGKPTGHIEVWEDETGRVRATAGKEVELTIDDITSDTDRVRWGQSLAFLYF